MNHNEDIEDGLEEFQAERERAIAEKEYLKKPTLFDTDTEVPAFMGIKAKSVILIGRRIKDDGHPFDFESGFISVDGIAGEVPHTLDVRWFDNGQVVEQSLRQI